MDWNKIVLVIIFTLSGLAVWYVVENGKWRKMRLGRYTWKDVFWLITFANKYKMNDALRSFSYYDDKLCLVYILIWRGADPEAQDFWGDTALSYAAIGDARNIMRLYIRKSVNLNTQNSQGDTPLHDAKTLEMTRLLVENGIDVNIKNKEGNTSLMIAILSNKYEILHYLIERGADLALTNKNGETVIHHAVYLDNPNLIRKLVKAGAISDVLNNQGRTALMLAIELERENIVRLLLRLGSNLNTVNRASESALTIAIERKSPRLVCVLLENGANPNPSQYRSIKEAGAFQSGLTFEIDTHLKLDNASRKRFIGMQTLEAAIFDKADILCLLMQIEKPPPFILDYAIIKASAAGALQAVVILLSYCCDVNACDAHQSTPLIRACKGGHLHVAQYLVASGADVNARDLNGMTPLAFAHKRSRPDIVRFLLEHGARPD